MDYLDGQQIAYDRVEVRGDEEKMKELKQISGQGRTPTMVWGGDVLADFGVDHSKKFLARRGAGSDPDVSQPESGSVRRGVRLRPFSRR